MNEAKPGLPEKPSFADFVAVRRAKRRQCKLCNSAHRAPVEEARESGGNWAELSEWLRTAHKEAISEGAIADHFKNGHHNEQR